MIGLALIIVSILSATQLKSVIVVDYVTAWPYEIKFNYEPGHTNDALEIRIDADETITKPEWKYNVRSEKFAYKKNQSGHKIQVSFDSNCDSMHLLINVTIN